MQLRKPNTLKEEFVTKDEEQELLEAIREIRTKVSEVKVAVGACIDEIAKIKAALPGLTP